MADTYKFRIDHHGSLVRPAELQAARASFTEGRIGRDELTAAENKAITDAVSLQRKLNLSVVSDGEFRRPDFRGAVINAVSGFSAAEGTEPSGLTRWEVSDKVVPTGALVVDDAAFAAEQTLIAAKATLPSPAYLVAHAFTGKTAEIYKSPDELGIALAAIIRDELQALIARGIRYIQLDNPDYARFYGRPNDGWLPDVPLDVLLGIDAAAVAGLERPEDVRIALVPDWGGHRGHGLDRDVAEKVLNSLPYDRFLLPFHEQAIVDEELLSLVPEQVDVCLGVVSAKTAELENVDDIMRRFDSAAAVKDHEDLAVSPQQGFEPAAYIPSALTIEQQRKKLEHVETIARMCWGNEL